MIIVSHVPGVFKAQNIRLSAWVVRCEACDHKILYLSNEGETDKREHTCDACGVVSTIGPFESHSRRTHTKPKTKRPRKGDSMAKVASDVTRHVDADQCNA